MMMRSWLEIPRGRGVRLFEHYDSLNVVQHGSEDTLTISLPPGILGLQAATVQKVCC